MNRTCCFLVVILYCTLLANAACPSTSAMSKFSALYGTSATDVVIQKGNQVLYDLASATITGITVQAGASLYFAWDKNITLSTQYIIVYGELYIGTEDCPITNIVDISLTDGVERSINNFPVGTKVIASGPSGVIEMHGAKGRSSITSWTRLGASVAKGTTRIQLADAVAMGDDRSWKVGDRIVITSTDYSHLQTEEATIKSIIDSRTIEIAAPLAYPHFGTFTHGVDERAEVGLLSRNIRIHGNNANNQGAHVLVGPGSEGAKIEGVELFDVGQDKIARYPIHFHMAGVTDGWYARFNSIYNSYFRCITIHATHNLLIESNVAYNCLGHCFYLEDGVERNNTFKRNLAILTKPKTTGEKIGSDGLDGISSFWITNPGNTFVDNVAAASVGTGFWIHVRLGARGVSKDTGKYNGVVPNQIPLQKFDGNRAHSVESGFQIEATYFDDKDVPKTSESPPATYAPRNPDGSQAQTVLNNYLAYKIRFRGIWARVEDIIVNNSTFADCYEGVQIATSGAHPPAPSVQVIQNSYFVGLSENVGFQESTMQYQTWDSALGASYPSKGEGLTGWKLYDGTQGAQDSTFTNFPQPEGSKYHAAIGTRLANHGQISTTNFAARVNFQNVTRRVYFVDKATDGGKQANFRDVTGSISGKPNSHILHDLPYYGTSACVKPEGNNWISCPHKYNQIWVLDYTRSQVTNSMKIMRNQHTGTSHQDYQLTFAGFSDSGVWRYQPIVSVNASYLIEFSSSVSNKMAFEMVNAEKDEMVEIIVCYPSGTSVSSIQLGLANPNGGGGIPAKNQAKAFPSAASRTDPGYQSGLKYYFDAQNSLLFFKLRQSNDRKYENFCPTAGCDFIWAEMIIPGNAAVRSCSASAVYSGLQITSDEWLSKTF